MNIQRAENVYTQNGVDAIQRTVGDRVKEIVSILDHGGADAYGRLTAAITAMTDGGVIDVRGLTADADISDDLTIPANFTLHMGGIAPLYIASGKTLTINGAIVAPPVQIFDGPGTVLIGRLKPTRCEEVYPQWWGAKGDGRRIQHAAMTAGDATLVSSDDPDEFSGFTADDVGKPIVVEGAGGSAGSFETLISTIVSINSSTSVELDDVASTNVTDSQAIWATNDDAAIAAAIAAHHRVRFINGIYGFTEIGIFARTCIKGNGKDSTLLSRMAVGSDGPSMAMIAGEVGQSLSLTDFTIMCNQLGTDGLACSEDNAFAFANNSLIDEIRIMAVPEIGCNLNVNVGKIGQIWIQNVPGQGTPNDLDIPDSIGFNATNTMLSATLISVEGHWQSGEVVLGAGASSIKEIQLEPIGIFPSSHSVRFTAGLQTVGLIFAAQWNGLSVERGDLVHIDALVRGITVGTTVNSSFVPIAYTNLYVDEDTGTTLIYDPAGRSVVSHYHNDGNGAAVYDDVLKVRMGKRFCEKRGTDTTVTGDTITLPYDGNFFGIAGSSDIKFINTVDWEDGSRISLFFNSARTIKHSSGSAPADTAKLSLACGHDIVTQAQQTMLTFRYDSGSDVWWQESQSTTGVLTGLATLDFGVIANQQQADLTVGISGAKAGDTVVVTPPNSVMSEPVVVTGWVSSANTVTVRVANYSTGSTGNFAAADFRIDVWPR